ncbi:hypothetical protein CVT26_000296 [Gymnopilus dilepis]|uniref:Non-structural maintenance of chromosomes element 4 n=1 Tax=Gymnopilus dilepis TaxID=231916 RepID=A0A409VHB7_9AGAR|nr:hypothetical protein CVT26_000296 [Gymnopilus dilepis]
MGAQKARAMKSGSGAFDMDEFISKLVRYMGGQQAVEDALPEDSDEDERQDQDESQPLDWERIGRKAMAKSRRIPAMGFMLGPLSLEQKKRAITKRAKLEKNKEDERKPQELREEDIQRSENETTKNVIVLQHLLEERGGDNPTNIFKFVINPNDFAQSVENIFYLSFLIRDGKVAFEMQDGEPMIYICEEPTEKDYEEGLKKNQMVLEFDMATWKASHSRLCSAHIVTRCSQRAIEVFNITESMIPQRPPARTKLGDKWYG